MRTNIEIDDELMSRAMAAAAGRTKKQVVEEGLRLVIAAAERHHAMEELKSLRGAHVWEGDLGAMRRDA